MSMIKAAISRLEELAATCEQNAAVNDDELETVQATLNRRNAASYREAIRRLQVSELPQDVPPAPAASTRRPQIGDKVVYHPRPIDRVRKPDNYNGLVSHTATVAHVHGENFYNLCAIDSGGVPYSVTNVIFCATQPAADVLGASVEYGGWFEFSLDDERK